MCSAVNGCILRIGLISLLTLTQPLPCQGGEIGIIIKPSPKSERALLHTGEIAEMRDDYLTSMSLCTALNSSVCRMQKYIPLDIKEAFSSTS